MAELLTVSEAAKILPNRPCADTVWRWARHGLLAADGTRIKLEHRRIGARIYIDSEDLERFSRELAVADSRHFEPDHRAVTQRRIVSAPEVRDAR